MFRSSKGMLNDQEELAYSFAPKLYRLVFARLGQREDTEDLLQEVYLKAFRSFNTFHAGTDMESWLTTITLNAIRDHIRKITKLGNVDSLDELTNKTVAVPDSLIEAKSPEA